MPRIRHILPLLLLAVLAIACEGGPPWGDDEAAAPTEVRPDFGPTAAYGRRLLFMGPGTQLPTASILDFSTLSDSAGVRRGVRARLLVDDEWQALIDAGWELEPMREPWRILPGGDLKIIVTDAGEIRAFAFQVEPPVRLEPGALLAESSPDAATQLVLRQATLSVGDRSVRGILLDSQLGRAVNPASVPRPLTPADGDTAAPLEPPAGRPTPIARPGAEGFLVNNSGYYAVFATSAGGEIAWISHAGRDEIRRGATLEPAAWSPAPAEDGVEDEIQMPTEWRIGGIGADLDGALTAEATDPASLADLGELAALGYTLVSGWVEDRGVRRDVFGLVRHVR